MKKIILCIVIVAVNLNAWEINTHRAINRKAIEKSVNLQTFVTNSGIKNVSYNNEIFEGYAMGYLTYITDTERGEGNGISQWNQTFDTKPSYQKLIEAGSILEDAQWKHFLDGGEWNLFDKAHGRFVNHFYDAQNGGHALTYGAFLRTDALNWALGSKIYSGSFGGQATYLNNPNIYTYNKALSYFSKAFTEASPTERRKYQAKMLVSVGHLLHLMNDMTSPAHTRDDSHPWGDAMEVCGRGGESGSEKKGFRVEGNTIKDYLGIMSSSGYINLPNIPKYNKFSDFISKESYWVSTHFFSNDTVFTKPKPAVSDTYEEFVSDDGVVEKYYIKSDGTTGIPRRTKLGIRIKSYIISELRGKYYTGDASKIVLNKSTFFKGDQTVLKDNAKLLIPRAISNARNFTNYFFRGQISAKIDGSNITIKNISDPSLVKDGYTATLKAHDNYFHLKYTTSNDDTLRDFTFQRDADRYKPVIAHIGPLDGVFTGGFTSLIDLAPGESIVIAIKRDTSIMSKNIVVVYDGKIGAERGLAVSAVQTPDIMAN